MAHNMISFSNKVKREKLNSGDHIYSWRKYKTYAHHGIYMGEDQVIHFTLTTADFKATRNAGPCQKCGYDSHDRIRMKGEVVRTCIDCFIGAGKKLYRAKYDIYPKMSKLTRGGTHYSFSSVPASDVVNRAERLLSNGFGDYHLLKKNCEDFAIYCKTGLLAAEEDQLGLSGQVNSYRKPICSIKVRVNNLKDIFDREHP